MVGLLHANMTCSDSARDSKLSRRRTESGLPEQRPRVKGAEVGSRVAVRHTDDGLRVVHARSLAQPVGASPAEAMLVEEGLATDAVALRDGLEDVFSADIGKSHVGIMPSACLHGCDMWAEP